MREISGWMGGSVARNFGSRFARAVVVVVVVAPPGKVSLSLSLSKALFLFCFISFFPYFPGFLDKGS